MDLESTPGTQHATDPPQPPTGDGPAYTHRRTGFVAQKPKLVRDKINYAILDGVPYKNVIESLGEDGNGLNEDHIGSWAKGGYKDFLLTLDRTQALRDSRDAAIDILNEKAGTPIQDASRTVAAEQLHELLLSFDPNSFADALVNKPELYLRLVNALARLSEGEATTGHRRAQQSLIDAKLNLQDPTAKKQPPTEQELKKLARQIIS